MAIISFKHRFIFIKTMKTAGTSLEIHLARHCGPDDIVTPIAPANPAHRPQNYAGPAGAEYFNHMSARLIRDLQPRAFASFFKFCFERHPVDKCLSHFGMLRNSPDHRLPGNPKTWREYLDRGDFPIDTARYVDDSADPDASRAIVDRIYRYEEMDAALRDISLRTGIGHGPLEAHEKRGFRDGTPSFDEVTNAPEQRALIFAAFRSSLRFTPYA